MKTLSKLLSLFFFSMLFLACQKENVEVQEFQPALFKDLEVLLPNGYDPKILGYSQDDYENLFANSVANARISGEDAPLNLSELTVLLRNVKSKYPDLSKMEDKEMEKALKYFAKMDKKGLNENRDTALDFFDKLISYDLAKEVGKSKSTKSNKRIVSYPYQLNSCEFWWLIDHPRFADKVEYATNKAFEFEVQKFGGNSGATHGDAFRHGIWNALLAKHGGENYGSVSTAVSLASQFTYLHEACASGGTEIDHKMDLHNNGVGLTYFSSVGYTYKVWCFIICNYNVTGPDDQTMANAIYSKSVVLVNSVSDIDNTNFYTLVKLQ
jgi:hypothetical protein